jgi:hypothetical protein
LEEKSEEKLESKSTSPHKSFILNRRSLNINKIKVKRIRDLNSLSITPTKPDPINPINPINPKFIIKTQQELESQQGKPNLFPSKTYIDYIVKKLGLVKRLSVGQLVSKFTNLNL